MSRIWIDVEDLFAYASAFRRPSGIQRTVFELCQALAAGDPDGVGFLRHSGGSGFAEIGWNAIAGLFDGLSAPSAAEHSLGQTRIAALAEIGRSLLPPARRSPPPRFAAGDTLLVAGAGWDDPSHARRLIGTKVAHRLRLAVLVYDLIPLRRPEWCDRQTASRFGRWIDTLLRAADTLLAISNATAVDVAARRVILGLAPLPCRVIRLGDGFTDAPIAACPVSGRFALFVSTLEIRKNHALLAEAWRVLLDRFGCDRVPRLVFAGREGPMVADLMHSLRASNFLDGHVIHLADSTDAELAALYHACDFTVFPSLYEGWGLPVAESLCFGTPCLASNATSVPEVGGELVRYFDPMSLSDTVAGIVTVIQAPAVLAQWRSEVAERFVPALWSATAATLLQAVRR